MSQSYIGSFTLIDCGAILVRVGTYNTYNKDRTRARQPENFTLQISRAGRHADTASIKFSEGEVTEVIEMRHETHPNGCVAAEKVVSDSICALHSDQARIYPGWKVALLAAGITLLPMVLLRPLVTSRRGKL